MSEIKIPCAYCGELKPWPDAFPSLIFAQCWECVEAECKEHEAKKWRNRLLAFLKRHSKMEIGA